MQSWPIASPCGLVEAPMWPRDLMIVSVVRISPLVGHRKRWRLVENEPASALLAKHSSGDRQSPRSRRRQRDGSTRRSGRKKAIPVLNFGRRRGRRSALGSKAEPRPDSKAI
jgi:hypothetical protein